MSAGRIFNPDAYKGKNLIEMAPEAKFTNIFQVLAFWGFNLWMLSKVGFMFGYDVLDKMFSWIPEALADLIGF